MYLKRLLIENLGPINRFEIELPFNLQGLPLPLVLVGPNGCGKTTVLSYIVNALVAFKQQVFEKVEVEKDRVFRIRSGRYIRLGTNWYQVKLDFEEGISFEEWYLSCPRSTFESTANPLPIDNGWRKIDGTDNQLISVEPNRNRSLPIGPVPKALERLFSENVVLYFPSDRFELPDWLNEESLRDDLQFPVANSMQGRTTRRIFSRTLLAETLQWLRAILLDSRLRDFVPCGVASSNGESTSWLPGFAQVQGADTALLEQCVSILAQVLCADTNSLSLSFGNRNQGVISANYRRGGEIHFLPSLLGLSAGQSSLFCMFCNVLRDLDMQGIPFKATEDVRGIVLIDEADLHLHVELQYYALPKLMKLFPRIQFVLTAHAPLLVMGIERVFADTQFEIRALPNGNQIASELFSEVQNAIDAFVETKQFDDRVIRYVQSLATPVVLVEGKTDKVHLEIAWKKLFPNVTQPWTIVPCGGEEEAQINRGGADMLRTILRGCVLHADRPIVGLFDQDREGMEQFKSLQSDGMEQVDRDSLHRKHPKKEIHAIPIPAPQNREDFVCEIPPCCYLSIEHYYSDEILTQHGIVGVPVAKDSAVFSIESKSKIKSSFASRIDDLSVAEFGNFTKLFDRLAKILGISIGDCTSGSNDANSHSIDAIDFGKSTIVGSFQTLSIDSETAENSETIFGTGPVVETEPS